MSTLSQRLIAHERRSATDAGEAARAAFLVCDRLRRPLCVLAGIAGYRALLARSLALARARAPWLVEVKIAPDAALDFPPEAAARLAPAEFERGGALLVSEFLGLLSVLIGDTLTLRLVSNAWPDLQPPPSETEMDHHE